MNNSNLFENIIHYAWQPVLLLSILWTLLFIILLFVRYQLRKEKTIGSNSQTDAENEAFSREIDQLAVYVSNLPRPKNIIRDYRNEELENGNE
jgi:hypothetical protein